MKETDIEYLLDSYLKGTCTPAEKAQLEQWFDQLSDAGNFAEGDFDKDATMQRMKGEIDRQITTGKYFRMSWKLRVAASVIFISAAAVYSYYQSTRTKMLQYTTTTAAKGEKKKVTLSDGSVVILNAGSSIRYPEVFASGKREVTLLEGEAFFDIQHRTGQPFTVATSGTATTVLGTSFNVQAYKAFHEVKVTVVTGKVAVKEAAYTVVLQPDEQVIMGGNAPQRKHLAAAESIAWIKGRLQFSNETLENVALILENRYNVKIAFRTEATGGIRFTANFGAAESLENILFAIAKANRLTWSVKDKVILF